jgi:hypothetical protein
LPRDVSIEAHLHSVLRPSDQEVADYRLIVNLIALMPDEPALRTAWLMACHQAEENSLRSWANALIIPSANSRSGCVPQRSWLPSE